MQTTMRAHDNFALNYAIARADELGLPVLVYHGLRHDYPWASDRFHTWILESVADLYADFEAKGIQYAFWLDRARGEYTEWPAGRRTTGSGKREAGSGARRAVPLPPSPFPLPRRHLWRWRGVPPWWSPTTSPPSSCRGSSGGSGRRWRRR
ncbi:MAG: hypothetical protein IPL76_05020 [Gemmatimonadetes bacterium]|nr:hypothetical protein [Gemmatimonadota bacterium]